MTEQLDLKKSIKLLERYGIKFVEHGFVKTKEEALKSAKKIGYPVVLKVVSKEILHKTDVGGVITNIRDGNELREAFDKIVASIKINVPNAKVECLIVQKMVRDGYEVMIGGIKDEQFGHCISFGLGGIYTEIYDDVSFRVVPVTKREALSMIEETKAYKILKGYRNKPKADLKALVDMIVKVSKLLRGNSSIVELDLNPVFALPRGAVVADVRIITDEHA